MYKILISGYYGFNNIGDESILQAVVDNLKERLDDIEITVLSQNPISTTEKYGVKSANRKSIKSVISSVKHCDLLISGGGSLLQDVTSKKSILYYLFIMWTAKLFGKKYFIYSQGIGPITSKFNRKITARVLHRASGIVVRDVSSKELLQEIGLDENQVVVTSDPVLRIKKADLHEGKEILITEGFKKIEGSTLVGFAVKEKKLESDFMNELYISMERLILEQNAQIVLIPFHFSEDMAAALSLESKLLLKGYGEKVCTLKHKYLTNEMLSIIGNMDVLVGIRLHSLIHAAIMDVPMIGISYDPKINSFMSSVGMKAMCSIYDFNNEFFIEEFTKTLANKEAIKIKVHENVKMLVERLDTNEEMIKSIMK